MTTYLSSYIINPVVRRLSHSGDPEASTSSSESNGPSQPHPTIARRTTGDEDRDVGLESVIADGEQDHEEAVDTMAQPPVESVSGQPMVSSPVSTPREEIPTQRAEGSSARQRTQRRTTIGERRAAGPHDASTSSTSTSSGRRRTRARTQPITSHARPVLFDDSTTDIPPFGILDRAAPLVQSPASTSVSSRSRGTTFNTAVNSGEGPSRRNTANSMSQASAGPGGDGAGGSSSSRARNGSLPADDGQSELRRRIIEIQGNPDMSIDEKARLMHVLMTEPYSHFHPGLHLAPLPRAHSPSSTHSQQPSDKGHSTGGDDDRRSASPVSESSIAAELNFNLSPSDIAPTYVPKTVHPTLKSSSASPADDVADLDEVGAVDESADEPALGCEHYKRNVKLQCSSCEKWYTCRFCHDQAEDHALVRKETKNMLCMRCGYAQPAGEDCSNCGERAAWYYCDICKLWDDDNEKSIYHCSDCGICRIGRGLGKDFYHCNTCCVCMSISIADSHRCIERSTDCDCPICGEYMFTSPLTVVFMQCGHSIHHQCYYDHMKSSYKCPICSRSIVNMEVQFRKLDRSIESQPMPPQFQDTKALVYCNDCCAKSSVKYHWLGLKCGVCDSYNTAQIQILTGDQALSPPLPSDPAPSDPSPESQHLSPPPLNIPPRPSAGLRRRPTSSSGHGASSNVRFSPYALPTRTGRSVSPIPTPSGYLDHSPGDDDVRMESDDEEEIDFWGGDGHSERRGSRAAAAADPGVDDEMHASGEEVEDEDEADDEDEDEDEDDRMQLFGHR